MVKMQYKEIQADSNGISKLSEILPTMKSLKADSEGADGGAEASQASSQAAPEKCCAESGTASCVEEKIDMYRRMGFRLAGVSASVYGGTVRHDMDMILNEDV